MKPGILIALSLYTALAFMACDTKDTSPTASADTVSKSKVIIKVVDAATFEPIKDAVVSLTGGSDQKTGEDGQTTLADVEAGVHFVQAGAAGFETMQDTVKAAVQGDAHPIAVTTVRTLSLYRKGVTLKGRILIKPDRLKAASKAAGKVSVEIHLDGKFLNPVRTVKTDDDGLFSFDSLPELVGYQIRIPEFTQSDRKYRLSLGTVVSDQNAGETVDLPVQILSPATTGSLQVLSGWNVTLAAGKSMDVVFSGKIDTSALTYGSIILQSGSYTIAAKLAWSDDLTTLSVTPFGSDWVSRSTYALRLTGFYDVQGDPLLTQTGGTYELITGALAPVGSAVGKVTGLRTHFSIYSPGTTRTVDTNVVDYLTSSYVLSWNRLSGAQGYDVYTRASADSAWLQQNTTGVDTQTIVYAQSSGNKQLHREHMVVPRGDKLQGDFSNAQTIVVTDGVRPTLNTTYYGLISPAGSNSYSSLNNTTRTTPVTLTYLVNTSAYSTVEPLDTNTVPDIKLSEGGRTLYGYGDSAYAATIGRFHWISTTQAQIELQVDAGKDGTGDTLLVDFSKVTDLAGNPFEDRTTKPVIRFITN